MTKPTRPSSATTRLLLAAATLHTAACASPLAASACPIPPPAVRDIELPRFYGDAEGSKVDPELQKLHKAAVAPLTEFLRQVVADTDKAVKRTDAAAAACPLGWLAAWAEADAWLGHMGTKQAEYQRKWDLAGVALAYVKLKPYATPAQRKAIEPWLLRFADKAKAFQVDPARKRNNHLYWLGLGLAATSIAADSPHHWDDARLIMQEAARHIRADGTLPLELERGQRALHYHAFATTPLVMMAELAARRGENWYAFGDGALHRLVGVTSAGLVAPAIFEKLTGVAQETASPGAGWSTLYDHRFPERRPAHLPKVPDKHRWLGGDVHLLLEAVPPPGRA